MDITFFEHKSFYPKTYLQGENIDDKDQFQEIKYINLPVLVLPDLNTQQEQSTFANPNLLAPFLLVLSTQLE